MTGAAAGSLSPGMQTPANQPQNPKNTGGAGGFLVVIGAVVVSVLLAGVLAWTVLGRDSAETGDGAVDSTVATTVPATVAPIEPSVPTIPAPVEVDDALTLWHSEQSPTLARLLAMLGAPPATNVEQLRTRCKQLGQIVEGLTTGAQPGRESVAVRYTEWLDGLTDAIDFCVSGTLDLPDKDAIVTASSSLGSTGVLWEGFFLELARYVDLRGPSGAP